MDRSKKKDKTQRLLFPPSSTERSQQSTEYEDCTMGAKRLRLERDVEMSDNKVEAKDRITVHLNRNPFHWNDGLENTTSNDISALFSSPKQDGPPRKRPRSSSFDNVQAGLVHNQPKRHRTILTTSDEPSIGLILEAAAHSDLSAMRQSKDEKKLRDEIRRTRESLGASARATTQALERAFDSLDRLKDAMDDLERPKGL